MTAPVVCSKTINLAHYQWLFKAVMQQWTKSMLQYSCQELDFPPTLNIAMRSHRRSFSRSSSWMKRHSKYDNMILHYRQKKIHCCCATLRQAHTLVYQHQQPTKNQQKHAHARVDPTRHDDRQEGGEEQRWAQKILLVFTTRNLIIFFVKVFLSHQVYGFFAWSAFQKFVPKIFKCTPLGICNEILHMYLLPIQ